MLRKVFIFFSGFLILISLVGLFYVRFKPDDKVTFDTVVEPLKIGGIVPLTGDRASYGVPLQRAAQMAVDEINSKGGIHGEQFQVIWKDGECDEQAAAKAAEDLIVGGRANYILGGVCSAETLAAAKIAETHHTLLISPASTSPRISEAGEYIFRLTPSDTLIGEVAARFAHQRLQSKNVVIIAQKTAYIEGLSAGFSKKFAALGGIIADTIEYTAEDRTQKLIKAALAHNPDLVYLLPDSPTEGIEQLIELHKLEAKIPIIVGEVLIDRELIAKHKEVFEGVWSLTGYFNEQNSELQAFLASYEAQFGEKPSFPYYMSNMYASVYLMKAGIERFGNSPERIKDWLLGLKSWPMISSSLTFDDRGDPLTSFTLLRMENGEAKVQGILDSANFQ